MSETRQRNRSEVAAVGLISGGLDSALALAHMHRLGFSVRAYHFANGFHATLHTGEGGSTALAAAAQLGIRVDVVDNSEHLLEVVKQPAHGYGANVNPCIDCRILMFRMATERMRSDGGDFLFTGEVVGQRPMSQRRQAMDLIDREAGVEGLVVRPLCGRNLPPTDIERRGLISREDLLDFSGRSRKPQIELARAYGITEYDSPAGGCLLTDPGYAIRLRDVLQFEAPDIREIQMLKLGRHFRLAPDARAVLGRNAEDCAKLESLLAPDEPAIQARDMTGPLATVRGRVDDDTLCRTAALVLRYAGAEAGREHVVTVGRADGSDEREVTVEPAAPEEATRLLVAAEGGCGGEAVAR